MKRQKFGALLLLGGGVVLGVAIGGQLVSWIVAMFQAGYWVPAAISAGLVVSFVGLALMRSSR